MADHDARDANLAAKSFTVFEDRDEQCSRIEQKSL